jgi:hypothetical protein
LLTVAVLKFIPKPVSKIVDHAQEQGTGRRKSAAYIWVCEHFKEVGNPHAADY